MNIADIKNPAQRALFQAVLDAVDRKHTPPIIEKPVRNKLDEEAESVIHGFIGRELRRRGIRYLHSDMRRKSTLPIGHPDFTCFMPGGTTIFFEVKTSTGQLSQVQEEYIADLRRDGFTVHVPRSFDEFLEMLK